MACRPLFFRGDPVDAEGKWRGCVMRPGSLTCFLFCLFSPISLLPGCQVFQAERSACVLVRDAETRKPISTAEVYLCQRLKGEEVAPCHSSGLTQTNGIAHLRLDPPSERGIQLQALAPGYLPDKLNVPADALTKLASTLSARGGEPERVDFIVDVYAEPAFTVELTLPPGYHGLVKAAIQIRDDQTPTPGERCFCFAVSPSGIVPITGPATLRRVAPADYRARTADGTALTATMDATKVGFRWVKSEGNAEYFVVGTLIEYEELCRRLMPERSRAASGSWEDGARKRRHRPDDDSSH
jgi:hypothetical protein